MPSSNAEKIRILLLLPIFAAMLGCPWDPDRRVTPPPPPPPDYKPQITISNVLHNLQLSYQEQKHEEYSKLLDEAFTFVFDPRDVGLDRAWPDLTWGRGEELDSAWNMFNGEANIDNQVVDQIELSFDEGEVRVSEENDQWRMVILTAVDLKLFTTEQNSGDEWILQTPGGYEAYMHFVLTDETDPETDAPIWKIVRWEDKPPRKKAVSTLG
jgi:hypothetical protein